MPPSERGLPLALPAVPYGWPAVHRPPRMTPSGAAAVSPHGLDSASVLEDELSSHPNDDCLSFWAVLSPLKEHSSLLFDVGLHDVSPMKLAALAMKAVRGRLRSSASIRSATGHLRSYVDFSNMDGLSDTAKICGPSSLMALRDFFEPLHSRGVTVPRTARSALSVFKDAVGFDWPLEHPLLSSVITCDDDPAPKHAPAFTLDLVFKFASLAEGPMVCSGKRLLSASILFMTLTSLRFSDVHRLKTLPVNDSFVFGALLNSKSKKPHGSDWPFAAPKRGFSGSAARLDPILDFRKAFGKVNGSPPSFLIPKLSFPWEIEQADPLSYSSARRKLLLLRIAAGAAAADAEQYTLHTPENFLPSCATELSFSVEDRNRLGHWQTGSAMCERYDRPTCTQEFPIRSTILANISEGWRPVGPFSIPVAPTVEVMAPKKRGLCSPDELAEIQSSFGEFANPSFPAPVSAERVGHFTGED